MAKKARDAAAARSISDPEPTIVRANVNRQTVTAEKFVSLYVNDTQVQVTPWDIKLIFGEITSVPTPENPAIIIKQIGEVRMSPQHAKKVTQVLLQQLEHYERTVGPIPLPD